MRKNKLIPLIIIFLTILFLNLFSVNAIESFPDKLTVQPQGNSLTLNDSLQVSTAYDKDDDLHYPYFHLKNSSEGIIICTGGKTNAPGAGKECTAQSFSQSSQSIGVGYIVNKIYNETNGTNNEKYWWSEFLINSYLDAYGYDYETNPSSYTYKNIINKSDYTILNTGMTYTDIISTAEVVASKEYIDITLSSDKTTISFSKGSDGYYYSDEITIQSNGEFTVELSNNKFSYTNNGNKYTFKIKESDISIGSTESLNITVNSIELPQTYHIAQNYNCGTGTQSVTLNQVKSISTTVASPLTINGSVQREAFTILIGKTNSQGQLISGAKLAFQTESDKNSAIDTTVLTSSSNYIEISGLSPGKYYVYEKEAPIGYTKSDKIIEIIILDDGTIKIDDKISSDRIVNVVNNKTKVSISKVDATGKKELPGATLEIQDKDGNIIKYCTDAEGNSNAECKWVSTDKPYIIEGLPAGKYYLVETISPEGYVLNKEKVAFEITNNNTVKTVKMENKLTKVKISKVNAVDKKELPGATLEIQDKDGNIIKYCTDAEGNSNAECKWVSTDKPYIIEGLPVGKYYLVETISPKGYVLNKEKIEFEVKNDQTIVEVEMVNDLEVEVPDTLSSRSALLLTIAMFDIAIGIGILTYVKKNKIKGN